MSNLLIIGATSAIAEHCARLWAVRGDNLFLVGRDALRLDAIARDLRIRGSGRVCTSVMDANDLESHERLYADVVAEFGAIDVLFVAHGTLSAQEACEQDVARTIAEMNTNGLSVISLVTIAANLFQSRGSGTIAVITSVAGDRGRASNYVYGSSKAMVSAFLSGVRQRVFASGIRVVDIRPGFIDSPMTADFRKGLLWATPLKIAPTIVRAVDAGTAVVYVPAFWRLIMLVIRFLPMAVFNRISF